MWIQTHNEHKSSDKVINNLILENEDREDEFKKNVSLSEEEENKFFD